jgi:hypothetical protein
LNIPAAWAIISHIVDVVGEAPVVSPANAVIALVLRLGVLLFVRVSSLLVHNLSRTYGRDQICPLNHCLVYWPASE